MDQPDASDTALATPGTVYCLFTTSPCALSVLVLLLGAVGIIVFSVFFEPKDLQTTDCNSMSCRRLSAVLRRGLTSNTTPCDDFYQFVCGAKGDVPVETNFFSTVRDVISHGNVSKSRDSVLRKSAALYQACLNVRRHAGRDARSLLQFLKQKRLRLMVDSDVDPLEAALTLDLRYGIKTLFDMKVQGGLLVVQKRSDLDAWIEEKNIMVVKNTYMSYMEGVFKVMDVNDRVQASALVDSVLTTEDLVLTLHSKTAPGDRLRKVFLSNVTNSRFLRQDQWKAYLSKNFERVVLSGQPMQKYLEAIFAQVPLSSLTLYVIWEVVRQFGPFFDVRLIQPDEILAVTEGRCFRTVLQFMEVPAVASILAEHVTVKSIESAQTMAVAVLKSLSQASKWSWLEDVSVSIANPEKIVFAADLQGTLSVIGDVHAAFGTVYLRALASMRQKDLDILDGAKDGPTITELLGVDVFYKHSDSVMEIPTSLLLPPYFAMDGPEALNFAGLGAIIVRGVMRRLLRGRINASLTSCLKRTAGEELTSDVLANSIYLDALFGAFRTTIPSIRLLEGTGSHWQEALFFIAFCRPWCLADDAAPLSCNLPVMNSVEFAHAFDCPEGSPMAPIYRCSGKSAQPSLVPH